MAGRAGNATSYRPFACSECAKSFTRSENLERHKRARHAGDSRKNFQCAKCQARFSRSDVYKRHSVRCRAQQQKQQQQQRSQPDGGPEPARQMMADMAPSPVLPWDLTGSFMAPEASSEQRSTFFNQTPKAYSASPSSTASENTNTAHVKAYFEHFHPSLPLLHRPTFMVASTPKPLRNITAVIGSLYSSISYDPDEAKACAQWRRRAWESGHKELQSLFSSDWREIRKSWVMQTWLLHIIFGAYMSDTVQFDKARRMLRILVDAVRELGLARQDIVMPGLQSLASQSGSQVSREESVTLYTRWMSYVNAESMKLSLYTLLFLDSHMFSSCNSRPLMSPMEFAWELPFPGDLWEAKNSEIWFQRVFEHFGSSDLLLIDNDSHVSRDPSTVSLSIATQQLMTESPSPELLAALAASPFATLCVLTNLGVLVRDFTRCYYQLPPSLSDPSAFHILTQAQNKQISAAVTSISKIVKNQAYTRESPQYLLWRTIKLSICSIKVSLCRPDNLLIGGIVDNSLIAGLATSTHLTLGSYVAVRRSVPSLSRQLGGDEGILAILNDLTGALSEIAGEWQECAVREAPWVTTASYGILLCIWGALRRGSTDIRNHLDTFNEIPRTSESCMLIFNTIMESIIANLCVENEAVSRDPRLWSVDMHTFVGLLEESEMLFVTLIKRVCKHRPVWGIGPSMATVLEEIQGDGQTIGIHGEQPRLG